MRGYPGGGEGVAEYSCCIPSWRQIKVTAVLTTRILPSLRKLKKMKSLLKHHGDDHEEE